MFERSRPNVIESDEGFSVRVLPRTGLIYMRGGKQVFVDSEILADDYGMVVIASRISHWDSGEPIDEQSRLAIVEDIARALHWDGNELDVR